MDAVQFSRITSPFSLETKPAAKAAGAEGSFAQLLEEGVQRLGEVQQDAQSQVRQLMAGEQVDLHRVVLASEKAGLAFDLFLSIRNKLVDSYQEVMRMQV